MENKNTKAAFVGISQFPVSLTYLFTDPPTLIAFGCKMAMSDDDKAARQAFYSQSQGDIDAGSFAYHVDMLSRIVESVEGLPGFNDLFDTPEIERPTMAEAIKAYFSTGEPLLRKIAADAIDRYNVVSQPAEFFR